MNDLISEVQKFDNELYKARYVEKDYEKRQKIWDNIKGNFVILELATKVIKTKFKDKDTFLAPTIVECMLIDYNRPKVDPNQLSFFEDFNIANNLYQSLIDKIYSNVELARIVLDGYSNGGNSFLLYTLINDDIDLTDEQKLFAIEEAMHKLGTTKYSKRMADYKKKLEKSNITDNLTVIVSKMGPIGAKTWNVYMAEVFASMNNNQAHGAGEYDICYYILRNHNFTNKMEQLVYDFYADDKAFDEIVDYWEWDIVNLCRDEESDEPVIYKDELLFIRDDEVINRLPLELAVKIINEIHFIKKIRKIRSSQCEVNNETFQRALI